MFAGFASAQIAIPTTLFMSDYERFGFYMDYRMKVEVTVPGNPVKGESFIVLDMNIPPEPGTCTLVKTTYTLGETATFTYTGWTDSDTVAEAILIGRLNIYVYIA